MALNDVYEVRFVTGTPVQLGVNVRHYRVSATTAPEPTPAQIAAALSPIFSPRYQGLMSSSATYRGCGVRRINPTPPSLEGTSTLGTNTGSQGGDPLPRAVSGIITLRTGFAGRKFRGRMYLPFPAESDNTADQKPAVGYITVLALMGDDLIQNRTVTVGLGSITLTPCIWHRRTRTFDDIVSYIARSSWATQRRRGDYGRPNLFFPF